MKYLVLVLALLFISCNNLNRAPAISREKGIVVAMQYAAPIDGTGTTTTYNTDDKFGFGITSLHTDEKYMVVFRCAHKVVFSINNQSLYAKLNEGDSVVIDYYELTNKFGIVDDFEFVTANPIQSHESTMEY